MTTSFRHSVLFAPLLLTVSLGSVSLIGCMVGPNYRTPAVPAPPAYKEPMPEATTSAPAGQDWWSVFNDTVLNDLEAQAITANQDIKIAVARFDQADAIRRSIHSSQLPAIAASPSAGRHRYEIVEVGIWPPGHMQR
jgi:multidrug efflux system outer membrane protein